MVHGRWLMVGAVALLSGVGLAQGTGVGRASGVTLLSRQSAPRPADGAALDVTEMSIEELQLALNAGW